MDEISVSVLQNETTISVVELAVDVTQSDEEHVELAVSSEVIGIEAVSGVPTVEVGAYGQAPNVTEETIMYATRVDFFSDTVIYRGEAAPGSAESSPVWRIRRITFAPDGDATTEWAGGTAGFAQVWDDRATLGYS